MPVTGLPVAVEAVLESLLSQYHLISWQVTGGERNVVLTLRWSLGDPDNDRLPQSPTRKPPDHRRSPHRHRHHGRSRRTSQWLQEQQQQETPDSTLERPRQHNHTGSDPCDTTPPTSPPVRHRRTNPAVDVVDGGGRSLSSREYYDYDSPPPLPPPPPNLDYSDGNGSGSYGLTSESEADSRTTQETVIERRSYTPHLRQPVRSDPSSGSNQDENSLTRKGSTNVKKPEPEGILKNKTVIVTENRTDPVGQAQCQSLGQSQGQGQDQSQGQSETEENSRRRRYHFRELIRKHSDEVQELAAERRRKENERERLREVEAAKAITRLKAQSEDNLLTRQDDEPHTDSDDNLRAKSEANIAAKNEDGTRRVRFSSEEGDNTEGKLVQGQGTGTEQGAQGAQGAGAAGKTETDSSLLPEEIDAELEAEVEEVVEEDDSEGDSPDADEIGRRDRPRRIGAMFRIGTMVARQRRRRALLK